MLSVVSSATFSSAIQPMMTYRVVILLLGYFVELPIRSW